jgi:hypothetical protein
MERLRRNIDLELDPFLVNSALIYEEAKRAALETICRQYLDFRRHRPSLEAPRNPPTGRWP